MNLDNFSLPVIYLIFIAGMLILSVAINETVLVAVYTAQPLRACTRNRARRKRFIYVIIT